MDYFKKELDLVKNELIREQCVKVLEAVNEEFFVAAASSTGKYHPTYALGDGGLYRHTRAAVGIAASLLELEQFDFGDLMHDYIICALILHDTCKSGINWDSRYTRHGHPIDASALIKNVLIAGDGESDAGTEFANNVCPLVESHMGQWNKCKWDGMVLPKPETDAEKFVHMCDYLASRKFLEYQFEEDNENE